MTNRAMGADLLAINHLSCHRFTQTRHRLLGGRNLLPPICANLSSSVADTVLPS